MGWAAIIQAIVQGVSNGIQTGIYINENKKQAKEIAQQAQEAADERAKQAKAAMQRQKTSFLKAGVYFDSGTPANVIEETYDTAMEDIKAIDNDSLKQQKKLIRAGKTALLTYLLNPTDNNGGQIANNIYQGFSSKSSSASANVAGSAATSSALKAVK